MLLKKEKAATVVTALLLLLVAGCASRPDPADQNYASLLYEEQGIFLQVRPNRDLALAEKMLSAVGMEASSMRTVLKRTHTAYCRFEFNSTGFEYSIIGEGRYPETIAALSLRNNPEWERRKGGAGLPLRWWENRGSGVQLSFIQQNAVCITNADIEQKLERIYTGPVVSMPEKAAELLDSGVLGIYSRNPVFGDTGGGTSGGGAPGASAQVSRLFARLDTISMSFQRSAEQSSIFTIDAEYLCDNETVARSLFLVLRLALMSGLRSLEGEYDVAKLLNEDPVSVEQKRVLLQGYPISLENIDWFFQQALPYVRIEE